jgi:hypothetical protein
MLILPMAIALAQPITLPTQTTEAEFCRSTDEYVARSASRLPSLQDGGNTRLDSVSGSCAEKVLVFNFTVLLMPFEVTPDWVAMTRRNFNRDRCENLSIAYRIAVEHGWRITANWTLPNGERASQTLAC